MNLEVALGPGPWFCKPVVAHVLILRLDSDSVVLVITGQNLACRGWESRAARCEAGPRWWRELFTKGPENSDSLWEGQSPYLSTQVSSLWRRPGELASSS